MKYKIVVDKQSRTNPSEEKREYEIDIEELRYKGDICDSLVITKDEDYVIRRLSLSEYGVLSVLDEEVKEPLEDVNIELFEGDNYIYLIDMVGNHFYVEYLVKNDFTDTYVTINQMNSVINQTAGQIELSVNQKLTEYATSEELEGAVTELNSTITQTADEITSTVSKKVGEDEVISKINQSAEEAGINANKIELSANDVLNLLAGNTINLNGKNISISSTNFNVDKDGNMSCTNANVQGKIETSEGTVGGWTINDNGLTNGVIFINSKGVSSIYTYADLLIIKGYIMGNTSLTNWAIKHYDLNGDGKVSTADYMTLKNLFDITEDD